MKRLIGFLLLLVLGVCGASTARASAIDEKVDLVFNGLKSRAKITLTYPNGAGIAHNDLKNILYVVSGETTLLDKGVLLVDSLETRDNYLASPPVYMKAAKELNADIIWAAVGAPGVDTSLLRSPLDWAKDKAINKGVSYADTRLPGVSSVYESYGKVYKPIAKYKAIQKLIDGVVGKFGVNVVNSFVFRYIEQVKEPTDGGDEEFWKLESDQPTGADGNPVALQNFINQRPIEERFDLRQFCRSAWSMNQVFTVKDNSGKTSLDGDVDSYVAKVKEQIKNYYSQRMSISAAKITEGNSRWRDMAFTVTLNKPLRYDVTAKYVTSSISATAVLDYGPSVLGKVTIKAGQTSATINIKVIGDTTEECDEQFRVTLSNPVGVLLDKESAIGTIVDDDYAGKISINDISLAEGNSGQKSARLLVTLTPPPLHSIEINYKTQDGTAKTPGDYIATSGTLLFKPSRVGLTVSVPVVGDTVVENDENFFVKISATGYKFEKSTGVAIIANDDAFTGQFSINDVSLSEANSGQQDAQFTVTLSKPSLRDISITYTTEDGTAQAPADYLANSGTLLFKAGVTSLSVSVPVVGDTAVESDETFFVKISASGYNFQKSTGVATILNNDQMVTPPSIPIGKIAFSAFNDSGYSDIYVMNADGSNQTRLTNNSKYDNNPMFSPDGSKIVFSSGSEGRYRIYVMNSDGSNQNEITNDSGAVNNFAPIFSPDGNKIAFLSSENDGKSGICLVNADGSNLFKFPTTGDFSEWPAFYPDGNKIAFMSGGVSGKSYVFLTNLYGVIDLVLADRDRDDSYITPDVSPDGKQIAFVAWKDPYHSDICSIGVDGTSKKVLTDGSGYYGVPIFLPQGGKIIFMNSTDGSNRIQIMDVDGGNPVYLTDINPYAYPLREPPTFCPDGSKIAFTMIVNSHPEIRVMNIDGSSQIKLADGESPSWAPGSVPAPAVSFATPAAASPTKPSAPTF